MTGNDVLDGGPGNDSLDGFDGDDSCGGGDGNVSLGESRFGDDRELNGGPGDDVLMVNAGADKLILGGDGNGPALRRDGQRRPRRRTRTRHSSPARASTRACRRWAATATTRCSTRLGTLDAGPGNDVLWQVGARGLAILQGGDGDDQLFVGTGTGSADCGPGNDIAFLTPAAQAADARHQLDRKRIGFAGCESIQPAPVGAEAPTFAGMADAYKALGVPGDHDVVAKALAYEEMDSCQRKNASCPDTDGPERIIGTNAADHSRADDSQGAGGNDDLTGGAAATPSSAASATTTSR